MMEVDHQCKSQSANILSNHVSFNLSVLAHHPTTTTVDEEDTVVEHVYRNLIQKPNELMKKFLMSDPILTLGLFSTSGSKTEIRLAGSLQILDSVRSPCISAVGPPPTLLWRDWRECGRHGIFTVCIPLYPTLSYCILLYHTLSHCILLHITVFYFILLYPTEFYCILLYPKCILLYPTVS